ncbi:MAG: sugar phosphate isomerase/epimerase, partial [Verrucomicrobiae bacterium]|nr:sugar phosphate isomerase/epimerase [Verrucomicrobiae bacterium]
LTRRQFLQAAAAAPAIMVLGAKPPPRPPVAIFSKLYQELHLSFDEAAAVTAEAAYDGIDCPVRPKGEIEPEKAADEMPRYAEALRKHNVRMLLLTTGITGVNSPHAETILRTAKKLGIRYYRTGWWRATTPSNEIVSQLRELGDLNRQIGVCAIVQNHSAGKSKTGYAGGDLRQMLEIMQSLPPEHIGVAFDLGHALATHGHDWIEHFEKLKPWIKVAYIKDYKIGTGFVAFGEGDFSKTDYFRRLRTMNYRAPFSIHIEYDWAKGQPKTKELMLKVLKDSRRALENWLAATT